MKYVAIDGGLGNQMFQYAFLLALKRKGHKVNLFLSNNNWEHKAGFELSRVFGIKKTKSLWELLYHNLPIPFRKLFLLTHKTYKDINFRYQQDALTVSGYRYYYGTWQSELYFTDIKSMIQNTYSFNLNMLNKETNRVLQILHTQEYVTISVHVRRGDYQSPAFINGFGDCCTVEYYEHAISYMKAHVKSRILFVFFSDDIQWAKQNIKVDNAVYVNHNHGKDSWQDMYLMSQCTNNIIANSSFSWWGAWLNANPHKIVIAPRHWWKTLEHDDVVPLSWKRM